MTETWWAPKDIVFTREQVEWLLEWLPLLREGKWPAEPTGYTNTAKVQKSHSCHASFETPCQIAGELEVRMTACGLDGYLAIEHYVWKVDIGAIAKRRFLEADDVERRISKVVSYISSGLWRRWQDRKTRKGKMKRGLSYREWRGHRKTEPLYS